ncbi:hypothetical protein V6N12_030784 [Hibiscus sabdariffa]|uniref:Uncharacterized protein n=1 Tax=Hibiscus sabdariffa TaxID=183260 RepID=A0ABR2E8Z6_9ROSI
MAKYKARTSYWRKKRIDKNPSPTLSIDGKEKAIADHTRGKENCFNEFNAYLNSQDSASKPVSPVTIGPSWVEVVEKSTGIDQNEKFGELEVAGENPVSDRVREDVLAMGLERHEAQLEDVDLEEGKLFYLG